MVVRPKAPSGFAINAQGYHVPLEKVKAVDKLRDELVFSLFVEADQLHRQLAEFKAKAMAELFAFIELSCSEYGIKNRSRKGNQQFLSYCGNYKIKLDNTDTKGCDERLIAAKELIDKCVERWSVNADSEIRQIVDRVFRPTKTGSIDIRQALLLKDLETDDPDWQKAVKALLDSIHVTHSKLHVNFYQRVGESDRWERLCLDLAKL